MTAVDRERIEAAILEILAAIGEDPRRDGLMDTPARVTDAYVEFFSGIGVDPVAQLGTPIPLEGADAEAVIVRELEFRSVCEHHLLPFLGVVHIAYLPADRVVGLGRLPRLVEALAARPQVQERLTEQIADALEAGLKPRGVLVVVDAEHSCVTTRGARQSRSSTVTIASRGELTEAAARAEIIALIGAGQHSGAISADTMHSPDTAHRVDTARPANTAQRADTGHSPDTAPRPDGRVG